MCLSGNKQFRCRFWPTSPKTWKDRTVITPKSTVFDPNNLPAFRPSNDTNMEIINEDWETWFTSKLQVEATFYAELCKRIKIGRELGRPIQLSQKTFFVRPIRSETCRPFGVTLWWTASLICTFYFMIFISWPCVFQNCQFHFLLFWYSALHY